MQLTNDGSGRLEQNSPVAEYGIATDDCCTMDCHIDERYLYTGAHQLTPGVRYVTPIGGSLQTPFDEYAAASRQYGMLTSHSYHSRDAGYFRSPNHILNPISGAHSMPEATPFQAIVNPLEHGYTGAHTTRPAGWHMSPSRGQHRSPADTGFGVGKTPSFRRTPGARRSNVGGDSPQVPLSCQPVPVAHPPLRSSSSIRTGPYHGTHTTSATAPVQEFVEHDRGRSQSASTASTYLASVRSGTAVGPTRFNDVADGVELIVSNLDYNISAHEWKKILTCEMQQKAQVDLSLFTTLYSVSLSDK